MQLYGLALSKLNEVVSVGECRDHNVSVFKNCLRSAIWTYQLFDDNRQVADLNV